MESARLFSLIFVICLVGLVQPLWAQNVTHEVDHQYWLSRQGESEVVAAEAYESNPHDIVKQFLEPESNVTSTRRALKGGANYKKMGKVCKAINPIDKCWRCRSNWASDRMRLAKCVRGFGHKTTGGLGGKFYVVTDSSDDDDFLVNPRPGTLRHAVTRNGPTWVIFARDMHIKLSQELMISSDTTIDARGADVHIAYGAGLSIHHVHNVIVHGLKIHNIVEKSGGMIRDSEDHYGFRTKSDGDGISVFGASNVWMDHLSMSRCQDGLIDVIQASTAITISNGHFTHHNDVMLLGASDNYTKDTMMQVTVAYNHFGKGLVQRMPRCRWGFVHVVNNDYTHWEMYAIGGSKYPTILSQGNRFIAPPNRKWAAEVTKRDFSEAPEWGEWNWKSDGDLFMNGAYFVESGRNNYKHPFTRKEIIRPKLGVAASLLTRYSGSLACKVGKPC